MSHAKEANIPKGNKKIRIKGDPQRGNPGMFKIMKKEILRKPKSLKLLMRGLQATHELGGLNVEEKKSQTPRPREIAHWAMDKSKSKEKIELTKGINQALALVK